MPLDQKYPFFAIQPKPSSVKYAKGLYIRIQMDITMQGRHNIWTDDLKAFFLSWKLVEKWKNDT